MKVVEISGKLALACALFELFESSGPVAVQKAGKGAICEKLAAGLAVHTVVGFVVGVANPLDRRAALDARLAIPAMNRHVFAEGGYLFREIAAGLVAQSLGPEGKSPADGPVEPAYVIRAELLRKRDRRHASLKKDFVRVGVADPAEEVRIGERPLQGMVLRSKHGRELFEVGIEHLQAAGVHGLQGRFAF